MASMNLPPRWLLRAKQLSVYSLVWFLAVWRSVALIGTAYQMELGNPSGAIVDTNNHDHYLIQRTVEAIDYSDNLGEPNWVSWDLTAGDIGSSGRSSSFYTDTTLPASFYHVTDGDYTGSGYTRGHMCPSVDRTDNTTDNKLVFYMSNIIPQTGDNNGGVWGGLEAYSDTLANAGDELLIICGPSAFDGSRIQPSGKVAIPGYDWKIVVVVPPGDGMAVDRITTSTRVIAVEIPNINGIAGIPWTSYVTSVNQIQADTGFTFFDALPPQVATVLRGLVDGTPAPAVTGFSPALGGTGTPVVITGTNFVAASAVSFDGAAASFTINSSTQITASVPGGATTGPITVITPGGVATSSSSFGMTNSDLVAILTQPASQTVDAGSAASFSVQALGAASLTYLWWKDGIALSDGGNLLGATSNCLSIASAGLTDVGSYSVVVSNYTGSVTSSIVMLTLNTNPPAIVTQPASQAVDVGSAALFSVWASGAAPLSYQWWKGGAALTDGGNLLGATSNCLSVASAGPADVGFYSVVVSNYSGSVTSVLVALTLNTNPPVIITQPANLTVLAGQNATFQVRATGTLPLAYLWRFNGASIGSATQSSYTRSNVQAADAGSYSVLLTNSFGSVTSAAATLTVQAAPPAQLIAQWSFDNTNSLSSPLPSTGSGSAALVGGTTAAWAGGSSTDTNAVNNAWNTTTYAAQGTGNKTAGVQFNVSTRGYQSLTISWDERLSNTGSKYVRLQYSTNGSDFIDGPVVTISAATVFQSKTNSLAGLPGVDDNPNFAFRVVAEFESTAIQTSNANYDTASTSSYGTGGTVRYDMVTVSGSPILVPSTLSVLSHGTNWFQLSAAGTAGQRYTLQCSSNLVTWTPMLTNTLPLIFTDTNLGPEALRFYRGVYSP